MSNTDNTEKEYVIHLNEALLKSQKVSDVQKENIISLHKELRKLFDRVQQMSEKEVEALAYSIRTQVEDIEFKLQENWGFEVSSDYHQYWFYIPHCNCPKMDNRELFGVDRRIYNCSCPIHKDLCEGLSNE